MTNFATSKLIKRQLRAAIVERLKGKTPAGDLVFLQRSVPTQAEERTCILVYATDETVEFFDVPKRYRRSLDVKVECIAVADDDEKLDLALEELADKVEVIMEADERLTVKGKPLANGLVLTGTSMTTDGQASNPMGMLALTYSIDFFTYANRPEEDDLPTLNTLETVTKLDDQAANDRTTQTFEPNEV